MAAGSPSPSELDSTTNRTCDNPHSWQRVVRSKFRFLDQFCPKQADVRVEQEQLFEPGHSVNMLEALFAQPSFTQLCVLQAENLQIDASSQVT